MHLARSFDHHFHCKLVVKLHGGHLFPDPMLQWSGILNSWVIGLRALLEFTSDIGSYYPVHVSQILHQIWFSKMKNYKIIEDLIFTNLKIFSGNWKSEKQYYRLNVH